jgi:MoaA/NifB/PqqE/SkfB family radical SAM enzyme
MASTLGKLQLLRGLLDGQKAYRGPFFVSIDVTRRCNNICLGCFFHSSESVHVKEGESGLQEFPLDLAPCLAKDLARLRTQEVILTGKGEPLLHSRFFEVVAAFKEAGLPVQLFTNGILLDGEMAQRIVAAGIDLLNVSIWAVTAEEHARWHPGVNPGALDKRIRGARAMTLAKKEAQSKFPRLNLQMPINRETLGNLATRIDLALEIRCDSVGFGYYRHYGSTYDDLTLQPGDMQAVVKELGPAVKRLESAGIRHDAKEFLRRVRTGLSWLRTPCYAPWYFCHISLDGSVQACPRCDKAMGNLREQSFLEIWQDSRYRDFRRQCRMRTPEAGLDCECMNCCMVKGNRTVHRVFRWVAPFARRFPREGAT